MANPPAPTRPRPNQALLWALVGAATALLVAAGGYFAWRALRNPVSREALTAFLESRSGSTVHFIKVDYATVGEGDGRLRVTYSATGLTTAPLYGRIDAADYLSRELHLEPGSSLPGAAGGDRPPPSGADLAALGPPPADPYLATILKQVTPAGAQVQYRGTLEAANAGAGWEFTVVEDSYGGAGAVPGRPRSSFKGQTFDSGDANDVAALVALAAKRRDYLAGVAEAGRREDTSRSKSRDERVKAFLKQLAPGTVFRGFATDGSGLRSPALFLEFTRVDDAEHQIYARLRNDGGWHDARLFWGDWRYDDPNDSFSVALSSRPGNAIPDAGPFVEDAQPLDLSLKVEAGGSLVGSDRTYRLEFSRLSEAQAASLERELSANYDEMLAATSPGTVYRGVVTSRSTQAADVLLLRFVRRDGTGSSIEARLESPTRRWQRPLAGRIIGNAHRSSKYPLRLETAAADAAPSADAASALGANEDLDLHLRMEDRDLVGGDADFAYKFSPATQVDLQQMSDARAARMRRLFQAIKPGVEFDGTFTDEQGYSVGLRLSIARASTEDHRVVLSVKTRGDTPLFREFSGGFDETDGTLNLESTSQYRVDRSGEISVPLFSAEGRFALQLSLAGDAIVGRINRDERSKMEFPVGAFLADIPALPAYPKVDGAYVLSGSSWIALPRNNGHAVPFKPKSKANPVVKELDEVLNSAAGQVLHTGAAGPLFGGKGGAQPERTGKAADLTFDGKDMVPQVEGSRVFVIRVGQAGVSPAVPPRTRKGSNERPAVEMAATSTGKEGARTVDLVHISAGVDGFGGQRVAAYVRELAPGVILFTSTGALDSGSYAVEAGDAYELGIR